MPRRVDSGEITVYCTHCAGARDELHAAHLTGLGRRRREPLERDLERERSPARRAHGDAEALLEPRGSRAIALFDRVAREHRLIGKGVVGTHGRRAGQSTSATDA